MAVCDLRSATQAETIISRDQEPSGNDCTASIFNPDYAGHSKFAPPCTRPVGSTRAPRSEFVGAPIPSVSTTGHGDELFSDLERKRVHAAGAGGRGCTGQVTARLLHYEVAPCRFVDEALSGCSNGHLQVRPPKERQQGNGADNTQAERDAPTDPAVDCDADGMVERKLTRTEECEH